MASELIINASLPETRIAIIEDGKIQDVLVERSTDRGITGNIYKGRVTRVLPGMQAAFVDIGLEKAAFLYVDDIYVDPRVWAIKSENEGVVSAEAQEMSDDSQTEESSDDQGEDLNEGSDEEAGEDAGEESPVQMSAEDDDLRGEVIVAPEDHTEGEPVANEGSMDSEGAMIEGQKGVFKKFKKFFKGRQEGVIEENSADDPEELRTDRSEISDQEGHGHDEAESVQDTLAAQGDGEEIASNMPNEAGATPEETGSPQIRIKPNYKNKMKEFRQRRARDRRIRPKSGMARPVRERVSIADLLQEGQEVIVQVSKDPIATKGARLTCHISLPGRHLVCMPTIDHVGVSRRIERDDERRMLRHLVEKNRPKDMGFIVRTASNSKNAEDNIRQDIDYLTSLWTEIKEKAATVSAPALVYEDLNPALRVIRDWVTDDLGKIIVDSRYHFNEIEKFVSSFMSSLKDKVELYHGDIPVFDAYGISTEMSRALERRVWLKSGGYIIIDQAEALVAIDVNTGRFVGNRNLEDTILKTNLEAANEIAYQLRLRNCGGMIIIDFIDMEKEENKWRVFRALEEALRKDRARPTVYRFNELGLVIMTRKRTRDTIIRTLCTSCAHCEGKGFIKSERTVAYEILREIERAGIDRNANRILVEAAPSVIDILAIDLRDTVDQLEKRYRKQVYLQAVLDSHPEQFEVITERKNAGKDDEERGGRQSHHRDRDHRGGGRHHRDRGGDRDHQRNDRRPRRDRNESADSGPPPQIILNPPIPRPIVDPNAAASEEVRSAEIIINQPQQEGHDHSENIGNGDSAPNSFQPNGNIPAGIAADMDDEDRLAYLRAQAAQDAAIAMLAGGQQAGPGARNGQAHARGPGGPIGRNGGGRFGRNTQGRGGPGGGRGGRNDRGRGGRGGRDSQRPGGRFHRNFRQDGATGGGITPVGEQGGSGERPEPVIVAPVVRDIPSSGSSDSGESNE